MANYCRKAVVVGGSNGIGLAISKNLLEKGLYPIILDQERPMDDAALTDGTKGAYQYCNLLDFDASQFEALSGREDIDLLMITAGVGRVAAFDNLHFSEVEKTLTIDLVSTIKIIKIFYDRIRGKMPFYCGVMGSIAGWLSSPMFAVYAAAKAGLCRFIESVNIELESSGTSNRILNVSPGSIKGTKFNGGQNDLSQTAGLAEEIVERLFHSEELYIPQYEEIFKGVLERYHEDPHEYGLYSYHYKTTSGRAAHVKGARIGYLSGTFDLFHVGHLNLLRRAKQKCDYLIVGVHRSGAWKGKATFIPLDERKAIVAACKYVDKVVDSCQEDSDAWELWHYDRLFVGSDYQGTERFKKYEEYFRDKDVEIIYFPYTRETSSTQIRKALEIKERG